VAINGTGWLGFRRGVRVRIGMPISLVHATSSRPTAAEVSRLTDGVQSALETLVSDYPDRPAPGRVGRWLTELFNDWPEGPRPPAAIARPHDDDLNPTG
jgi:hypothetical protein